jgi:steroid 5-alpha reductase family enzyme
MPEPITDDTTSMVASSVPSSGTRRSRGCALLAAAGAAAAGSRAVVVTRPATYVARHGIVDAAVRVSCKRRVSAPLASTAALIAAAMLALWALSLGLRDVSIVDVFWGLGFVMVAHWTRAAATGYAPRGWLVAVLVTAWGTRLALYLLWRNWGAGEDYRYAAMRRRWGDRFPAASLVVVFGLQAILMWIVSLPVQVAIAAPAPRALVVLDVVGTVLVVGGLACETIGDLQLARFKRDPANRGRVLDRGLWRYTRHPNYFGDAVVWWGLFAFALTTPAHAWTVVGPLVMTYLLTRLSGVPLLERKLTRTRPAYADYVARTSGFVPWPPRAAKSERF